MSNAKHAKTLPKAQQTQGIEYFYSINNFRSEQQLQQALNSCLVTIPESKSNPIQCSNFNKSNIKIFDTIQSFGPLGDTNQLVILIWWYHIQNIIRPLIWSQVGPRMACEALLIFERFITLAAFRWSFTRMDSNKCAAA